MNNPPDTNITNTNIRICIFCNSQINIGSFGYQPLAEHYKIHAHTYFDQTKEMNEEYEILRTSKFLPNEEKAQENLNIIKSLQNDLKEQITGNFQLTALVERVRSNNNRLATALREVVSLKNAILEELRLEKLKKGD